MKETNDAPLDTLPASYSHHVSTPGLHTGGWGGISLKSYHWQNHCTVAEKLRLHVSEKMAFLNHKIETERFLLGHKLSEEIFS